MLIHNKFNTEIVCIPQYMIAYLPIPKVANTSILNALFMLLPEQERIQRLESVRSSNPPVPLSSPSIVHFRKGEMFHPILSKNKDLSKYFVFTCVRHPVERFISFYRDKILRWDPFIENRMVALGYYQGMSVDECIEVLTSIPYSDQEPHLIPLSMYCYYKGKNVIDYLIKLEDIERGWETIEKLIGKKIDLSVANSSDIQKVRKISINDRQRSRVEEYYSEDMSFFGY